MTVADTGSMAAKSLSWAQTLIWLCVAVQVGEVVAAMRGDGVKWDGHAVCRLCGYCSQAGCPAEAFHVFKVCCMGMYVDVCMYFPMSVYCMGM